MPANASKKSGQGTILSFFQRAAAKPAPTPRATPLQESKKPSPISPVPVSPSDDGSASLNTPLSQETPKRRQEAPSSPLKRRKQIVDDSDSDEGSDFVPDAAAESDMDIDEPEPEPAPTRKASSSRRSSTKSDSVTPTSSQNNAGSYEKSESPSGIVRSALSKFDAKSDYVPHPELAANVQKSFVEKKLRSAGIDEERYKWLLNIKDADGLAPDHPDYDPRTLYIPKSAWAKFTAFERQYWEIKSKMWNTVVFFKKGKFYELYENDAEIAHTTFDLKLAGGGRANMSLCGVPEMSFDYWASAFIAKGYKIARVDQAESALGKEMRDRDTNAPKSKEDKIIKRELSCILTAGTLTDATMLVSDLAQYCMAIKQDGSRFGVCFVDTATGAFSLSEFEDTADYTQLETLVAQLRPREILIERGNMDRNAVKLIRNNVSVDTLWETLKSGEEFWDAETTKHNLVAANYFDAEDPDDTSKYPAALKNALDNDLALSAVGGLTWYLRTLKLDRQLISMAQFDTYSAFKTTAGAMVLDGQTLTNLEVFANTWDGGSDGTIFRLVNKCVTPFGKRRLRSWVAHPLQDPVEIAARADSVDMLLAQDELRGAIEAKLTGLPDAERMLSRVHAGALKPKDFVRLVHGLEKMDAFLRWLGIQELGGGHLQQIATSCSAIPIGPWMDAFDHQRAQSEDVLVPEPGVEAEFDASKAEISGIEQSLQKLLRGYRSSFGSQLLEFRDSGKEIYLVEVPAKLASKVPRDWQLMGATAKAKRFWPPDVRTIVRQLQEALETHKRIAADVQFRLYAKFSADQDAWLDATRAVAAVDCLVSLARASAALPVHCRPEIIVDSKAETVIDFKQLRHPCAPADFIPNDVVLGGNAQISLLTGANAAGKSTVLRMTGAAVLLAQLGCHVPATEARLTPVDRILTRLGASDNIFAGKSTFHVELSETQRILAEATPRSLVVLDELGRGGSSADGLAIAEAVLHHLATETGCVGFFATHYGTLVDAFRTHPRIIPQRMAVSVDRASREVTFLYVLEPGQSEGSFGMNVAAMCGVAPDIVDEAEQAAKQFMGSKKRRVQEQEPIPLGLESDLVHALAASTSGRVVGVMLQMAVKL